MDQGQDKTVKTLVVRVDRLIKHGRYGKYLTRSKRYLVHNETGRFKDGDRVQIVETRPYSRRKHFKIVVAQSTAPMIQPQTIVKIADNTGAKVGRVFKVLGGSRRRYARIGDLVILSVQSAEPKKTVKKKEVVRAVVVRQRRPFRRLDGSYISFDDNAVLLLEKEKLEPLGGRIFGPIPRELAEFGHKKIISLASEIV